jgi:ATP-dependent DNA helicase PIF1
MLMRNLDPPLLCNGTRLVVTGLLDRCIQAKVITGQEAGQTVLIPRIPFIPSDTAIPFKRLQYPLTLCFAFSMNKSQGQTLKVVGLYLAEPGMLTSTFFFVC